MNTQNSRNKQSGFTLIELSIVLVIIGLIVGGVLVGQDLIKAAEVRATITQIEKYNTSVRTFQGKFGGLPGDLVASTAAQYGIFDLTTVGGTAGFGDGNGLIEGGAAGSSAFLGEPAVFWKHLTDAGLADGNYGTNLVKATGASASQSIAGTYIPAAKLARGNSFTVASSNGFNYYFIAGLGSATQITIATGVYAAGTNNLTPQEGQNIDAKVDDGKPFSGSVTALNAINPLSTAANIVSPTVSGTIYTVTATAGTAANCATGTAATNAVADTYNVRLASPACSLRIRFN